MVQIFAAQVFFICFRESLETSIIVSVLLSFLKQTLSREDEKPVYRKLVRQVWLGVILGLAICLIIGGTMIVIFYRFQSDLFAKYDYIWEGVFGFIASAIITIMGAALLRISKLRDKWRVKIAAALEANSADETSSGDTGLKGLKLFGEKYAMFLLPFVTALREGLEGVVFIGGVSLGLPAASFPLAVVCGLGAGALIGFLLYRGGNASSLQLFLVASTCFLYLVAAGLLSRSVWFLENYPWNTALGGDAAETGSGPGSYDIRQSVWHVNCCNPEIDGGGWWGVFNSLLGWQNSATYGSVISYNLYCVAVGAGFLVMGLREKYGGWSVSRYKGKSNTRVVT
ncbi:iron permease FTR1 family protein [Macroventuria anomochaeta]|uniref:Iron permease FTR1 family protein n=1 Tax=Macroventuria anomochaeta TaxID=301207 RepID=A0ACB6S8H2_9PLEO|nr:iron permease FTR1 family protein [Macroventuria anomochaeta]KAF2629514.1 iron permease FTR1 family protein [Macroventuria anomochaeta]